MLRFSCVGLALALSTVWLVGCGPSGPKVVIAKGKLVQKGAPLAVPRSDVGLGWVQLELIPDGGEGQLHEVTRAKDDGTFSFIGEGRGVLPGNYKLAVLYYEQGPPTDKLNGAFSPEATPIKVTVAGDQGAEVDLGTIDLDNPPK